MKDKYYILYYILYTMLVAYLSYTLFEGPARRKFETMHALRQPRTQLLPGPSLPASRKKDKSIVTVFKMVAQI